MLKVFKFGGASVKDASGMKNVCSIIQKYQEHALIIVVSAIGKTTNALEEVIHLHAQNNPEAKTKLQKIKSDHIQLAEELGCYDASTAEALNDILVEAEWVLDEPPHANYDFMYDQIICIGELISSVILAALMNKSGIATEWVDARNMIVTDDIHREGWVQWTETTKKVKATLHPILESGKKILTQGFIGSTKDNITTTLGREGSDYTAAILTHCMDAVDMTIWKDVPGVLTADPRRFEQVTKLDKLSYREAIEMTYYGAKVIHPKTIKPLQNKSIPLLVKSFLKPEDEGTVINDMVDDTYPPIVAIESNQVMLNIATNDFSFVAEHHLSDIFRKLSELRLQVNMMQNTAISFSVCITNVADRVKILIDQLKADFTVAVTHEVELITARHYTDALLQELQKDKLVLMEDYLKNTCQMVVKKIPMLKEKELR